MEKCIAIYSSHDSSITFQDKNGRYHVLELERLKKERFYRFDNKDDYKDTYNLIKSILSEKFGILSFDTCLEHLLPNSHKEYLKELFGIKNFKFVGHHIAHAACALYQSPFDKALIISIDGGGYDGEEDQENRVSFFNIYIGDKKDGIRKIKTFKYDMGTSYGLLSIPISEITKTEEDWGKKFLSFAGKFMGLCAYADKELLDNSTLYQPIKDFYLTHKSINLDRDFASLKEQTQLSMGINTLSGQDAANFAGVGQKAFEDVILETIKPFIEQYNLPVCMTGGCALNILFNQKLVDLGLKVFVPPNPSDCGLSFGMLALETKPTESVNLMYNGWPILDIDELENYISKHNAQKTNTYELAKLLSEGMIIGVVRGDSECGPRALGNRSILCDPTWDGAKDHLNNKVKFRESFRPYSPIVRVEDVGRCFEFNRDSRYMSFSPKVRDVWKKEIPAVVHHDGTSRVQTVDKSDNPWLYELLGRFTEYTGHGVLLNTSFNIKGLPILTTIHDALEVLRQTELDAVVIEDYLFLRGMV